MRIVTRWSKTLGKNYISVSIDNMTADQFCDTLLEALHIKEKKYSAVVANMKKTDKYYTLARHILCRTQEQIIEVEGAKYEHFCKMQDKLEKGNVL